MTGLSLSMKMEHMAIYQASHNASRDIFQHANMQQINKQQILQRDNLLLVQVTAINN